MRDEESYSAVYRFNENSLSVRFYVFDSEFDGNDFIYDFYYDHDNTEKILSSFGLNLTDGDVENNISVLRARFGENIYASDLKEYSIEHGIHFRLHDYEDYPGGCNNWYSF